MSAFAEFVCIAIALFLWESTLWLPLGNIALRRRGRGKWKILDPAEFFAARETGLIPMRLWPTDGGLAPCQAPPLIAAGDGLFLLPVAGGKSWETASLEWADLVEESHHLNAGGRKLRISSPRNLAALKRAKKRGISLEAAVRGGWRRSLSAVRASREWRRWQRVSAPLRMYGSCLTVGFFVGLPVMYLYVGLWQMLMLALTLWWLMACIAGHLWWLARRVYPEARGPLRMDALLALLVPFHAMRASEIACVHAMGGTHPIALLLATGDFDNAWLARTIRETLHPLPGSPHNAGYCAALEPLLTDALASAGKRPVDFDVPPSRTSDPAAERYCPRCHALYLASVQTCGDCRDLPLRDFT